MIPDGSTRINLEFNTSDNNINLSFGSDEAFNVDFGQVQYINLGGEEYDGPYIVTPEFEAQTLDTTNKHLSNDVVVLEIPMSEVSNMSGGLTLNIGDVSNG